MFKGSKGKGKDGKGKYGKEQQQQQKFHGTCNICGKTGHKREDCWFKEKATYKGKDPKGKTYKGKDAKGKGKSKHGCGKGKMKGKSKDKTGTTDKDGKKAERFEGYCNGCGKLGHRLRDCWAGKPKQLIVLEGARRRCRRRHR